MYTNKQEKLYGITSIRVHTSKGTFNVLAYIYVYTYQQE